MKLKNETYDLLVVISEIWISALVVFILAVGKIWNIPYTTAIAGTIEALGIMLGTILKGSRELFWGSTIIEDEIEDNEEDENIDELEAMIEEDTELIDDTE